MKALILPGNSVPNRAWAQQLASAIKPDFKNVITHSYLHWQTQLPVIDIEAEAKTLRQKVDAEKPYTLLAKSAGVLLSFYGVSKGLLPAPSNAVFMGLPLGWANEQGWEYDKWLTHSFPCTFIHNQNDPVAPASVVKDYLANSGLGKCKFVVLPGDTHNYDDFEAIKAAYQQVRT